MCEEKDKEKEPNPEPTGGAGKPPKDPV